VSESQASVRIEDINPIKKKLSFEIPWEEIKNEREAVLREVGKSARVKGFRPGRVPRPILERQYGDYIREETVTNVVSKFYWDAIRDHNIRPLSQPEIERGPFEDEAPFTFMVTVEVEPVIEPKGYYGLTVEKQSIEATEEEIERRLRTIQEMYATMEEVNEDRPVAWGDYVTIAFEGRVDGVLREDLKADEFLLHCEAEAFLPGFADQVIGMKVGEEKEFTLQIPEGYRDKEVAGKEVTFHVSIKGIKERKLPPLDDEFVKIFERYDTSDDLRQDVRVVIENEKKEQAQAAKKEAILDQLLAKNEVTAPEALVERQVMYMMMDSHRYWTMRGMDAKGAADIIVEMKEMYREQAEKLVKSLLLLKSIAAKEGIEVTEEEREAYIADMARRQGQDVENYRRRLEEQGINEQVEMELLMRKTIDFIESKGEVVEKGEVSA